jgi:hypothetical protein
MVFSNSLYPAKATFQSNKESNDAGSYIQNKTVSTTFCKAKCPDKLRISTNYQNLYAFRTARLIKKNICRPTFNNNDLNINLFTKMDLTNVCTVSKNTTGCTSSIKPSDTFYLTYTIDPSGVLFGNTECGISNFENFLVPNPPPLLESGISRQEKQNSCVKKCIN